MKSMFKTIYIILWSFYNKKIKWTFSDFVTCDFFIINHLPLFYKKFKGEIRREAMDTEKKNPESKIIFNLKMRLLESKERRVISKK
eukprot:GAHX01001844.1.p1 GENE.GAHX01001844.1~~GAHX01001844.1.p1  ORF type:complete len:86 (-),score=16.78 GAHX01001844.1:446-703(-)